MMVVTIVMFIVVVAFLGVYHIWLTSCLYSFDESNASYEQKSLRFAFGSRDNSGEYAYRVPMGTC